MKVFGLTIFRTKALNAINTYRSAIHTWWSHVREPYTGAWQRNCELETTGNLTSSSTIYSCISLISNDIAKLRIKLVQKLPSGVWKEFESAAFSPVLRKPNRYQTRIQFIAYWIVSKLLYGNAYILLEREGREVVRAMYVLDARSVTPLVSDDGAVYYRLKKDNLSGLMVDDLVVPASEIIHDRMNCLFHPLVGIPPIYAAALSGTQSLKIQRQSTKFFADGGRPIGLLSVPGSLTDEQAAKYKEKWDANYGENGVGGTAILSGGMVYTAMSQPAIQAQLAEQLKWTVEDQARPYHVPLHKINAGQPTLNNIGALNQDYYAQALQIHIESAESLLVDALNLAPKGYGVEFDLDGLLRMDQLSIAESSAKLVGAGIQAPNEARLKINLEPVKGGNSPFLQQQNYSLEDLSTRSAKPDPFASTPTVLPAPEPEADQEDDSEEEAKAWTAFREGITKGLEYV